MRASTGSDGPNQSDDLPAVLQASDAKRLAEMSLARSWEQRHKLTVRLSPSFLSLRPGEMLTVPDVPVDWTVKRVTVDSMAILAELCPAWGSVPTVPAGSWLARPVHSPPGAAPTMKVILAALRAHGLIAI